MEKTTIQLRESTLKRLKSLKRFERESYDEVLNSILDEIEEETLSEEEIKEIKQGLDDVRMGRVYSIEKVATELGINLK